MDGQAFTQANEGLTLTAKLDRNGRYECGYGCQGPDIVEGTIWDQATAQARFAAAYAIAGSDAEKAVGPVWPALGSVRQAAVTDLSYELGLPELLKFQRMLSAIRQYQWATAYNECLTSQYAQEVPTRAQKVADMLASGEWPNG